MEQEMVFKFEYFTTEEASVVVIPEKLGGGSVTLNKSKKDNCTAQTAVEVVLKGNSRCWGEQYFQQRVKRTHRQLMFDRPPDEVVEIRGRDLLVFLYD